jgi:uncharacterized protein (TIGR03435 family)
MNSLEASKHPHENSHRQRYLPAPAYGPSDRRSGCQRVPAAGRLFACVTLMTTLVFAMLFSGIVVYAQQFEVAAVRPSPPEALLESFVPTLNLAPGTTFHLRNRQLKELIQIAYGIGGKQIFGPRWLIDPPMALWEIPRFDIEAKVPMNAKPQDGPMMLRELLAERFHLRAHNEERQITIYGIDLGKSGLKVRPNAGQGGASGCARSLFGQDGVTTAVCSNMTVAQLAQQLQTLSPAYFPEGPVVDKTGLRETYTFTLEWITLQQRDEGADGPSMFDAIEKLGMHLEKQKGKAEVLVVDNIDPKPTDN